MDTYSKRVRDNILPLSIGNTLPEAFEEWSFTEEQIDHEEPCATCGLCDKDSLRYHFRIRNALTNKRLWVGSHCILKFGLSVFENGQRLSPKDAKKKLDRLTQQMRLEACLKALGKLAQAEKGSIIATALEYFRKNKFLTPRLASVVLWQLDARGIDHSPSFFKVTLKRDLHKQDLKALKPTMFRYVWPALTPAQRKTAISLGRTEPK